MNMLWIYYEHMFQLLICSGNPKRIIIVSSGHLICSIISQRFNLCCCIKPKIYLNIETVKQIGRYLIRYADAGLWLKYLQIIMKQCIVKPA